MWSPRAQASEGHWGKMTSSRHGNEVMLHAGQFPLAWNTLHSRAFRRPQVLQESKSKRLLTLRLFPLAGRWPGAERSLFLCCLEALGSIGRQKAMFYIQPFSLMGRHPGAKYTYFLCPPALCSESPPRVAGRLLSKKSMAEGPLTVGILSRFVLNPLQS